MPAAMIVLSLLNEMLCLADEVVRAFGKQFLDAEFTGCDELVERRFGSGPRGPAGLDSMP